MINKKDYINRIDKISTIFSKYGFLKNKIELVNEIKDSALDFAFRVILIGGFSSGKSALLNRLAGSELFKENLGPETAVPAEISYAPIESAHAIYSDGSATHIDINSATANPPANALFISMRLDKDFFKNRPELVLVDFPGYDSNVDAHNKAINTYLKRGSAFIILIPAQNGTLGQSDIKFLREASSYPQNLACLVSKSDLVEEQKLKDITSYIQDGIFSIYGESVPTKAISVKDGTNEEFETIISSIIDNFNPQSLFDLALAPTINEQLSTGIEALEEYINACGLDSREIDERITRAQYEQEDLSQQLEKERCSLDSKYTNEIIPDIIDNIKRSLNGNLDMLVDAALQGEQRFSDAVQGIVRPILAGVSGIIQSNLRDVIVHMPIVKTSDTSDNDSDIRDILLNIVNVISTVIPSMSGKGGQSIPTVGRGKGTAASSGGFNLNSILSGAGTGAIVGTMVNPIIGVVIGLAPAIIEIFFGNKDKQPQADPRIQIRTQLEVQTIPAILNRIEDMVTPAVMETRDMMFEEIRKRIAESMKVAAEALEQAKKEKEALASSHENRLAQMRSDTDELRNLIISNERIS